MRSKYLEGQHASELLESWRNFDSTRSGGSPCPPYSQNHKRDLINMGTWKQAFRPMMMIVCTVACASSLKFSSNLGLAGIHCTVSCRYQIRSQYFKISILR